jgi:hypothetical protein
MLWIIRLGLHGGEGLLGFFHDIETDHNDPAQRTLDPVRPHRLFAAAPLLTAARRIGAE